MQLAAARAGVFGSIGLVLASSMELRAQTVVDSWLISGNVSAVRTVDDMDADGLPDMCFVSFDTAHVISSASGSTIRTFTPAPGKQLQALDSGDFDGDGIADLTLGAPFHVVGNSAVGGAWVYSGATSQLIWSDEGESPNERLGSALAFVADLNGDGRAELAVGAPGVSSGAGRVRVHSIQASQALFERNGVGVNTGVGAGLVVVSDLNGDGREELVIRATQFGYSPAMSSYELVSLAGPSTLFTFPLLGGKEIQEVGDIDGDGVHDLVVGIQAYSSNGAPCSVYSGASGALIGSPPSTVPGVIYSGSGGVLSRVADLDGDGLAEEYATPLAVEPWFGEDVIRVFRGLQPLTVIYPIGYSAPGGYLQVLDVAPDLNGDGVPELLTVKSLSANQSKVEALTLVDPPAQIYCSAKVNSQGCTPAISATGAASLTGAHALGITANQVVNQRTGLFLWSLGAASTPFLGGTLCVAPPFHRTAPQNTGGSALGADCTGTLGFTVTTPFLWLSGFELGAELYGQFWYRDGAHPDGTSTGLTDAVNFLVCF